MLGLVESLGLAVSSVGVVEIRGLEVSSLGSVATLSLATSLIGFCVPRSWPPSCVDTLVFSTDRSIISTQQRRRRTPTAMIRPCKILLRLNWLRVDIFVKTSCDSSSSWL